jgi:hypothetical protein
MKKLALMFLLLFLAAGMLSAEEGTQNDESRFDLGRVIRQNNLHRIGGYFTLGMVAATGTAGVLGLDIHPVLGYATLASAGMSSIAGSIAYRDRLETVWPHLLLNGVGIGALVLNAFVLEPGSVEHRLSGAVAAGSFAGAYISIILINR